MLRKAVHSGLLAPDPENTIIAIAERLLLQYIHRVKTIFVATVGGESNTSIEQMWEVLCPPARGTPGLFSSIVGKCTGTVYRLKEGKYGNT